MANDFTSERVAIQTAFKAGFIDPGTGAAPFLVRYENQPFTRKEGEPYCELSVAGGNTTDGEIGGSLKRAVGVVYLRMFLPENGGVKPFELAAGLFEKIFDLKTFSIEGGTITFERTGVITMGKDATTGLYQKNARVNFRRDTFSELNNA